MPARVRTIGLLVLAAGPGERSRIYKTADGGRSWVLQFTNTDSSAFYDCFAFWDAQRGESAFAASGTCVVATGGRFAWIGTGAADTARVLVTRDRGAVGKR